MNDQIAAAQKLVVRDFNLKDPDNTFSNAEKLHSWLTNEISLLLDRDFERLMNVLYRIDISEDKTKLALAASNPASELAKLIMQRELQKVESRKKYK